MTINKLVKDINDATEVCCDYTAKNIPESIRIITFVRQFIQPKPIGHVVSKNELDIEKLSPFIERASLLLRNNKPENSSESADNHGIRFLLEIQIDDLRLVHCEFSNFYI